MKIYLKPKMALLLITALVLGLIFLATFSITMRNDLHAAQRKLVELQAKFGPIDPDAPQIGTGSDDDPYSIEAPRIEEMSEGVYWALIRESRKIGRGTIETWIINSKLGKSYRVKDGNYTGVEVKTTKINDTIFAAKWIKYSPADSTDYFNAQTGQLLFSTAYHGGQVIEISKGGNKYQFYLAVDCNMGLANEDGVLESQTTGLRLNSETIPFSKPHPVTCRQNDELGGIDVDYLGDISLAFGNQQMYFVLPWGEYVVIDLNNITMSGVHFASTINNPEINSLNWEIIRNAKFDIVSPAGTKLDVTLSNGEYASLMGGDEGTYVSLRSIQQFALGDLDGDGIKDAAAFLAVKLPKESYFYPLVILLNKNGLPVHVASKIFDNQGRGKLTIEDGIISRWDTIYNKVKDKFIVVNNKLETL
ncbi:hypothetical protein HY477_03740 [Candidatus Uhrbacteria bacterium]|nr:hypothetical protein [Candidatus Uhrbacteria bacterium]